MTVSAGAIRNPYTGDGVTTIFPYTFKIFKASELQVQLDGVVAVTGYSVDGIENSSGGNVTFTFAPANGVKILFISITTRSQDTDWVENDPMSAKSVEDAFDKAMKIDKEQDEVLARALRLAPSSIYSNLLVPDPSTGKFLRWKDLTQLDNADLVPLGGLGLPVSFANGGSGANYASAAALAKGLGLSLWGGSDQGPNVLTITAGIGQLPNPLTTNIFTCSANLNGFTTAGILVGTKIIIYWNGAALVATHSGTFFLMARVNHTFTTGDMSEFTYVGGGSWIETYRYISALVTHGPQFWRGDGSWADVDRIKESGGQVMTLGAVTANQVLRRVGTSVVGYTPPFTLEFISADQTITVATVLNVAHGLGVKPKFVQVTLKNTTAELGYSIGDEIPIVGEMVETNTANKTVLVVFDATNVTIITSSTAPAIRNKSGTDPAVAITVGSWRFVVRAWA